MYRNGDYEVAYALGRQAEVNRRNIIALNNRLNVLDKRVARTSLALTLIMLGGYILKSQVHGINERLKRLEGLEEEGVTQEE